MGRVIFISVISLTSPIGMCAQLSLFFSHSGKRAGGDTRPMGPGCVVGCGGGRGADLVVEKWDISGVERYEVLSKT